MIAAKACRLDAGGIGFKTHFRIGRDRPVLGDGVEYGADRCGLHQGRRTAAEENTRDRASRYAGRRGGDLRRESPYVARLINRGMAYMAVEITIRAFRQTEWPVHVDAKRTGGAAGGRCSCHPGQLMTLLAWRDRESVGVTINCSIVMLRTGGIPGHDLECPLDDPRMGLLHRRGRRLCAVFGCSRAGLSADVDAERSTTDHRIRAQVAAGFHA